MAGRLLLPAFPQSRALPWALGGVSAAVLLYGLVRGETTTFTVGAVGLAGCIVAFPLSRLLLGHPPVDEPNPQLPGADAGHEPPTRNQQPPTSN